MSTPAYTKMCYHTWQQCTHMLTKNSFILDNWLVCQLDTKYCKHLTERGMQDQYHIASENMLLTLHRLELSSL